MYSMTHVSIEVAAYLCGLMQHNQHAIIINNPALQRMEESVSHLSWKKHRGIAESNTLLKWFCDSPKHGVILLKIDTAQIRQRGSAGNVGRMSVTL